MSVTEVHGALGLDKLKNRTFQIFKVKWRCSIFTFHGEGGLAALTRTRLINVSIFMHVVT